MNTSRAHKSFAISFCVIVALLGALTTAHAAVTTCVQAGDIAGLQAALAAAAVNGQDDIILLQRGSYDMPSSFALKYYPNAETKDLEISGGYEDFFGNPCGLAPSASDARATVLNGGQLDLTLPDGSGSITLSALTIANMQSDNQHAVPVSIGALANSTGSVSVRNTSFFGNVSTGNQAVFLGNSQGSILVQDSVFAQNGSFAGVSPVEVANFGASGTLCTEVINVTVRQNNSSSPAMEVRNATCQSVLANDIFWGNNGGNIAVAFPPMTGVVNSDFEDLSEVSGTPSSGLISLDPLFNSQGGLQDASPLRDAGIDGVPVFSLGTYDVIGNPRVFGNAPDMGAFEIQEFIFASSFEPTN